MNLPTDVIIFQEDAPLCFCCAVKQVLKDEAEVKFTLRLEDLHNNYYMGNATCSCCNTLLF